jgi:CRP-like cAMP-binding protein
MAHTLFILGELTDQDVDWLIATGRRASVDAGTVLICEGEPVTRLYILLVGRLEVTTRDRQLAILKPGELVGEMSFIDARPPSATVRTAEEALLFVVSRARLVERLDREADFAARFYKAIAMSLSHRLREMDQAFAIGSSASADADELDPNVLDTVHLAGLRFERVLKRLIQDTE